MKNLLDPRPLTQAQARAVLQGMAHVARADGDDAREVILMREFWDACSPEATSGLSFQQVRNAPFELESVRAALPSQSLQQTFLAYCLLVAYSDGEASSAEQQTLATLIQDLNLDDETVTSTHARVNELLFKQVERVSDLDTLRRISGEL